MKILFFLLFVTTLYGQTTNVAYYNIKYLFEEPSSEVSMRFNRYFENAIKYQDDVILTLKFNKQRAVFERDDMLKNKLNEPAFTLCLCENPVFTDLVNKQIKYNNKGSAVSGILENEYLVHKDIFNDWELLNDQKIINGYLTFKAKKIVKNIEGKHEEIIAWYAPELSFPFGPSIYSGLPGLIVQLQEREKMFVLTKIDFNTNEELISEPKEGKIISAENYEKLEFDNYNNFIK